MTWLVMLSTITAFYSDFNFGNDLENFVLLVLMYFFLSINTYNK